MKPIEIRLCNEEETVRIGQFYDDVVLWLDDHINYPHWVYQIYPCEESVRAMAEAGCQYVFSEGEEVLAAFALNAEPQGSYQKGNWSRDLPDGSYLVIHALAIDPRKQGQGIGTQVLRFCVGQAKARHFQAIRADIVPTNVPARRMVEKCGFRYVGDVDLEMDIEDIPVFSLYELNL